MDPATIAILLTVILIICLGFGVWIGAALLIAGFFAMESKELTARVRSTHKQIKSHSTVVHWLGLLGSSNKTSASGPVTDSSGTQLSDV